MQHFISVSAVNRVNPPKYYNFTNLIEIIITFFSMCYRFNFIILLLKNNYKIREFNITLWNTYRLLEGMVFAHIPAAILLYLLVCNITINRQTKFKFLDTNIYKVVNKR